MKNRLLERFNEKILAVDPSIEEHKVQSYIAYRIKSGRTFIRLYPDKITMKLPFNEIKVKDREKYSFKDNSDRYPRHELPTKGPQLDQKYLGADFTGLVKKAFLWIKDK